MIGGTTAVRNIPYDGYLGTRLPPKQQLERVRQVIANELTPHQREVLMAYYFQEQNISEIAQERGVCKSTVSRTLHRAEKKLREYLKY